MIKHECWKWSLGALVFGILLVGHAFAQDGASPSPAMGIGEYDTIARLAGAAGLPGVLAWLGWQLGRKGPLTLRIEFGPETKEFIKGLIKK